MAEERRQVQRRPPIVAVRVDRVLLDKTFDALELAGGAGLEDRQLRAARHEEIYDLLTLVVDGRQDRAAGVAARVDERGRGGHHRFHPIELTRFDGVEELLHGLPPPIPTIVS